LMTMNESSTTPYYVDGDDSTGGDVDEVVIRFLKELEGSSTRARSWRDSATPIRRGSTNSARWREPGGSSS
jgi:hypothetical protein